MAKSRRIYLGAPDSEGGACESANFTPEPQWVPTAKLITFLSPESLVEIADMKRMPLYRLVDSFEQYQEY